MMSWMGPPRVIRWQEGHYNQGQTVTKVPLAALQVRAACPLATNTADHHVTLVRTIGDCNIH